MQQWSHAWLQSVFKATVCLNCLRTVECGPQPSPVFSICQSPHQLSHTSDALALADVTLATQSVSVSLFLLLHVYSSVNSVFILPFLFSSANLVCVCIVCSVP